MKKLNSLLRKCKSLSRQIGRSSSYSSLRSKSSRECSRLSMLQDENGETIYVGTSRRRYVINARYLTHPLLNALIEKSKHDRGSDISIQCEVVLFDHLLWMLENGDAGIELESLEELADFYVQSSSGETVGEDIADDNHYMENYLSPKMAKDQ